MIPEFFDHILCINLDRRPDRWSFLEPSYAALGLSVTRFSATDGSLLPDSLVSAFFAANKGRLVKHEKTERWVRGTLGCLESHIQALSYAYHQGWPSFLLIEDDAAPHPDLVSYVSSQISHLPSDWLSLRLAGGSIPYPRSVNRQHLAGKVFRVRKIWSCLATVYKRDAILPLLSLYQQGIRASDVYHMDFDSLGRSYAIMPFPIALAFTQSDIGPWDGFDSMWKNTLFKGPTVWKMP